MTRAQTANSSVLQLFQVRDFTLLWLGRIISYMGDWLLLVALPVWVYQLTGSTAALGLMVVVETVPALLFAPLAGVFVDRWDRRKVMVVADVFRGLVVLALLLVRSQDQLVIVYVVGFTNAAFGTFFVPARQSLLPTVLGKSLLLKGNAVFQMSWLLIQMVGPILGGVLLVQLGPYPLFVLDSASFFVSALAAGLLVNSAQTGATQNPWNAGQFKTEFVDGLRVLRDNPILWNTMLIWIVLTFAQGSINPLIVAYVQQALHGSAGDFAALLTVLGVGLVAGAALTMTVGAKQVPLSLFKAGLFVLAPAMFVVANAPNLIIAAVAVCLTGMAMAVIGVSDSTIVQQETPPEFRGRVLSVDQALHSLAILVAAGIAGTLAEPLGVRVVFNLAAFLVIGAALFALPRLRTTDQSR
jgi:MFS family permease